MDQTYKDISVHIVRAVCSIMFENKWGLRELSIILARRGIFWNGGAGNILENLFFEDTWGGGGVKKLFCVLLPQISMWNYKYYSKTVQWGMREQNFFTHLWVECKCFWHVHGGNEHFYHRGTFQPPWPLLSTTIDLGFDSQECPALRLFLLFVCSSFTVVSAIGNSLFFKFSFRSTISSWRGITTSFTASAIII